jgi:hypothetical protein
MTGSKLVSFFFTALALFLTTPGAAPAQNVPKEATGVHKGVCVLSGGQNYFRPCGSAQTYWVAGEQEVLLILRQQYNKTAKVPADEVYVELRGQTGPKLNQGAAEKHNGVIRVDSVLAIRERKGNECALPPARPKPSK